MELKQKELHNKFKVEKKTYVKGWGIYFITLKINIAEDEQIWISDIKINKTLNGKVLMTLPQRKQEIIIGEKIIKTSVNMFKISKKLAIEIYRYLNSLDWDEKKQVDHVKADESDFNDKITNDLEEKFNKI